MADTTSKIPIKTEKRPATQSGFVPAAQSTSGYWGPFDVLRREIDQLFDRLHEPTSRLALNRQPSSLFDIAWPEFSWPQFSWPREAGFNLAPAVDVVENDKDYEITAELPGLDEKNIEVKVSNGTLLIKGEKREEREENEKGHYLNERRFGAFSRAFALPSSIDINRIEAHFSKGVLTVKLPKSAEAMKNDKTIEVKAA